MKKLLFLIPFLIPTFSMADSTSTGTVYERIVATGVIDTQKGWMQKINENTQITVTELTRIKTNISAIANDTTTLNNGNNLQNGIDVVRSTHIADGDLKGIDIAPGTIGGTQTVRGILDGVLPDEIGVLKASHTASGNIGNLLQNGIGVLTSTMTNGSLIQAGSNNANVVTSTMANGSLIQAGSGNAGVITSTMANGSLIQSGSNNFGIIFDSNTAHAQPGSIWESSPTWTGSPVFKSSVTFSSPTISIGGNQEIFQSTPAQNADTVLHRAPSGFSYWGGDAVGSGGGGGGTSVFNATFTKTMICSGDLALSTYPVGACSDPYVQTESTAHFVSVRWDITPSTEGYNTCSSTWSFMSSTGSWAGVEGAVWKGIDDSSWTIRYDSTTSVNFHKPTMANNVNAGTLFPGERIWPFQSTNHNACGGRAPAGATATIRLWEEPQQ